MLPVVRRLAAVPLLVAALTAQGCLAAAVAVGAAPILDSVGKRLA